MQLMVWDHAYDYHNINLFNKYLLGIYHMLGTVTGLEYTVKKMIQIPK